MNVAKAAWHHDGDAALFCGLCLTKPAIRRGWEGERQDNELMTKEVEAEKMLSMEGRTANSVGPYGSVSKNRGTP